MAGFGDLVQKAFYLGVGIASYATEKAGSTLGELRSQAQKLADEMVARGEITAEDAKKMVDEMVSRAQQQPDPSSSSPDAQPSQPRRIEILSEDDPVNPVAPADRAADELRDQIAKLQEELQRLKKN
ncbi:MAG: phasin family protein [Cyanobacteria bacterium CAN_BIN43]|nr:phasin family protein [Cyanobacteria bacterium CAN_BIN43]